MLLVRTTSGAHLWAPVVTCARVCCAAGVATQSVARVTGRAQVSSISGTGGTRLGRAICTRTRIARKRIGTRFAGELCGSSAAQAIFFCTGAGRASLWRAVCTRAREFLDTSVDP